MIRLRSSILSSFLSSPGIPLRRLLSATATPAVSSSPSFAVDEYLVATCGLTRAQALKASGKISHLKSRTNPDAVLAFLAGLGLPTADVAALVSKDPKFLCTGVDRTLVPIVVGLTDLGLSRSQIARLVSYAPLCFRTRSVVSKLPYYLNLLGSYENLLRLLKSYSGFLDRNPEKLVKPKVALLRECGLSACDIAKLCLHMPRMLNSNTQHVHMMVACAESLGVPRGSVMFRQALRAVAFLSKEEVAAKVDNLKIVSRWSDAEVRMAVSRHPLMLMRSKESLQRTSEFLISEVGLEPAYIAHRSALLTYSLEGRLRPRYYVVKFLKKNGLLKRDLSYCTVAKVAEKLFVEKFICPHKEAVPHLSEDYAAACAGEVPARFMFA